MALYGNNFKTLTNDDQFQTELNNSGGKLIVVDFSSASCPPCQVIAPVFAEMATRYPNARFLKVDVRQCPSTAQTQGVTATPTFLFFRNKIKLDSVHGADADALEAKIRQHYSEGDGEETDDCGVPGQIDLLPMLNKSGCECLNESDDHVFSNILSGSASFLESDTDEQMIMSLDFNQAVKVHSFKVKAPIDSGPKTLRFFINQPYTLDFEAAESNTAVQEIELTPKDLNGETVNLKYVRFQNIKNLTIFVKDNQTSCETTKLTYLQLIGSPMQTTNMSDFKRVAGKKGESH